MFEKHVRMSVCVSGEEREFSEYRSIFNEMNDKYEPEI